MKNMVARFQELIMTWAYKRHLPLHIVYFEDLVKDTKHELVKMLNFLQLPTTPDLLDCVIANKDGTFKRKRKHADIGSDRERTKFLSDEVIKLTDCGLRRVEKFLPGIYERYAQKQFCVK